MARVTLRLPEKLHVQVRQLSRERGVSLNDLIVSALADSFENQTPTPTGEESVVDRASRLRAILGDLAEPVTKLPYASPLGPDASLAERAAFRKSFPVLDPPLSATIIEEREDRM